MVKEKKKDAIHKNWGQENKTQTVQCPGLLGWM